MHNFFLPSGQSSCIIVAGSICRCDGIGRRSGLKIHRQRWRTGSTPVTGTTNGAPALQVRFVFSGGLMHRSKKAYKKHTRTLPLSQNDKVLYLVLICFSGALPFLTYLVLSVIRTQIAFRPPSVLAYTAHLSQLWALPLYFFLLCSTMIPLLIGWQNRHPLLRYGSAAKMKEPPSSKQNTRRILLAAGCIGLLLTLIPACLSISGRDCMLSDNRIVSYNALNRPSEVYTDFSSLTIRTYRQTRSRAISFAVDITTEDGTHFIFTNNDFRGFGLERSSRALQAMTQLKESFPSDMIKIRGTHELDAVIASQHLDSAQAEQLRILFSV